MLGNISDEKANELILTISENVRGNLLGRSIVDSQLFPVTHYIHVACLILYDQAYQYNLTSEFAKVISPEEIGRRNKTLGAYLNELYFNSFAMLYLHGRAQCIYDNIERKRAGEKIIIEPEEKKKETKFLLDYWSRLCPNYRNDGKMTAEDGTIQCIPEEVIDPLQEDLAPASPESIKIIKRAIGLLTARNFLASADCRASIFEHGPYEVGSPHEKLIFKEFTDLYTDKNPFDLDRFMMDYQKTKVKSEYPNVIIGLKLKDTKLTYNDWGTCFSEPSDYSNNIQSIGIWTKEQDIHPKNMRFPDKLGTLKPISIEMLDHLMNYCQKSLNEMFIDIAGWNKVRKIMAGVNVYTNFGAKFAPFAGLEKNWDWGWVNDVWKGQQNSDLVTTKDVLRYIEEIGKYREGLHPFLNRFFRARRKRMNDACYYFLQD